MLNLLAQKTLFVKTDFSVFFKIMNRCHSHCRHISAKLFLSFYKSFMIIDLSLVANNFFNKRLSSNKDMLVDDYWPTSCDNGGLGDWAISFFFWIIFLKKFKHEVQGICGQVHWLKNPMLAYGKNMPRNNQLSGFFAQKK